VLFGDCVYFALVGRDLNLTPTSSSSLSSLYSPKEHRVTKVNWTVGQDNMAAKKLPSMNG